MQIGHIFEKQEKPKVALEYQLKALNIFIQLNDSIKLAQTYLNLGSIYEDYKDYETALNYFEKAALYNGYFNDMNQRAEILNNIGDYHQKTGKSNQSISFFKQALLCARKSKDVHQEISALKDLSESYYQLNRFQEAYQVLDSANTLSKKNLFESNNNQVAGIQALNNIREKENKITLLEKDAIIKSSQQYLFIALIGISLLIGFSIYLIYRQRLKKKEMEKEHQLIEYETKIEVAQKEEENLKNEIDLKNKTLSSYALQTVQDKKVLKQVYDQLKQIQKHPQDKRDGYLLSITSDLKSSLQDKNHWEEFKTFFDQVHPEFVHNLTKMNTELSAAEIRLSVLLRMNMNSKDIATILKISPDSVRIARYRLRKKLPIQQGDDLLNFISKI
jgi:tetratricopeptide (TPR) repeat protein